MRITFLTQWFDPEPGNSRGLLLAEWMVGRGHEVEVVTGFPNYPSGVIYPGYRLGAYRREVVRDVRILRVPLYPSHDRSGLRRTANYVSFAISASTIGTTLARKADVNYVYHPPGTIGLPAILWKSLRSTPFLYSIADMWPESVTESGMIGNERLRLTVDRLLGAWCKAVYRSADAITVVSPGFKRLLVERGVPADKIEMIYNWADESIFFPRPRDERLAAELSLAGRFNVVYSGNLGPYQNLDVAIRAAAKVQHLSGFQLVFIGTGRAEQELRDLARDLGLSNVRFVPRQDYRRMGEITNLAEVLLVSLEDRPFFSSTIPGKAQVALAAGKPIIMAVRGDSADLVFQSGAGLVCAPGDEAQLAAAFEHMYSAQPPDLARFGAAARNFYVRRLSFEQGAQRTEAMLQTLAERRHRSQRAIG